MSRTTAKQRTAQNSTLKRWIDQRRLHMRVWWLHMRKRSTDVSLWSTVMVMLSVSVGGASTVRGVWEQKDFLPGPKSSLSANKEAIADKIVAIATLLTPGEYEDDAAYEAALNAGLDKVKRKLGHAGEVRNLVPTTLLGGVRKATVTAEDHLRRLINKIDTNDSPGAEPFSLDEAILSVQQKLKSDEDLARSLGAFLADWTGRLDADASSLKEAVQAVRRKIPAGGAYVTDALTQQIARLAVPPSGKLNDDGLPKTEYTLEVALNKVSALLGGDTTKSIYERLEALVTLAGTATHDEEADAGNQTVVNRLDLIAQALRGRNGKTSILTAIKMLSTDLDEDATGMYAPHVAQDAARVKEVLGSANPALTSARDAQRQTAPGQPLSTTITELNDKLEGIDGADIVDKLETLRVAIYHLLVESGTATTPSELRPEDSLKKLTGYFGDYVLQQYCSSE